MSKETRRLKRSSRAVRRLEPYNKSSSQQGHSQLSQGSRHESPEREEPPNQTEEPPSWAKVLLQQQKRYSKELKKLKNELDNAKLRKHGKLSDSKSRSFVSKETKSSTNLIMCLGLSSSKKVSNLY